MGMQSQLPRNGEQWEKNIGADTADENVGACFKEHRLRPLFEERPFEARMTLSRSDPFFPSMRVRKKRLEAIGSREICHGSQREAFGLLSRKAFQAADPVRWHFHATPKPKKSRMPLCASRLAGHPMAETFFATVGGRADTKACWLALETVPNTRSFCTARILESTERSTVPTRFRLGTGPEQET